MKELKKTIIKHNFEVCSYTKEETSPEKCKKQSIGQKYGHPLYFYLHHKTQFFQPLLR